MLPTFVQPVPSWWPWQQPVRLGLDLQGGTHLLYRVQLEKGLENRLDQIGRDVENVAARQAGRRVHGGPGGRARCRSVSANRERRADVKAILQEQFPALALTESAAGDAADFTLALTPREEQAARERFVEQALQILRNRIDQFGVAEPTIQAQGADEIVVQLPGIQDPQRAKDLIGRTALLEFKLMAQGPAGRARRRAPGPASRCCRDGRATATQYLLEKRPIVTGDMLTDAQVRPGSALEGYAVDFVFDSRGASLFGDATTRNVGRNLAIVLDGVVQSAPQIREPITGGHGQITGRFDLAEAQDLANVLRNGVAAGAADAARGAHRRARRSGRTRSGPGRFSFIVGSWRSSCSCCSTTAAAGRSPTWRCSPTCCSCSGRSRRSASRSRCPGIAGIVLTVGMAVDANILILERDARGAARRARARARSSTPGYERAWAAILDSNVTTFLVGPDPVPVRHRTGAGLRGHPLLGIVTTLITAVFLTRVVYDWLVIGKRVATVSV